MSKVAQVTASTEEHIRAVAKRIFVSKGYAGTTIRDIAEAANTNVALLNYYFRSKEKLFVQVFEESLREFFASMLNMLNQELTVREKIENLIDRDFDFLTQNTEIPLFIMHEIRSNESNFIKEMALHNHFWESYFFRQVNEAMVKGEMRKMESIELIVLILSNIQFVFMAKPMIMLIAQMDDAAYLALLQAHKIRIKEMLFSYLFFKQENL